MDDTVTSVKPLLPSWVQICGLVFLIGQMLFVGRIIFESTVLTCDNGPQILGWSMFHGNHRLFLAGLPFVPLACLWLVVVVVAGLRKRIRYSTCEWILLSAIFAGESLLLIPYSVWENLDVNVCGPGAHGAQFLEEAAARGDVGLVKVLLKGSYDHNFEDEGATPLTAAILNGKVDVVTLLLAHGANVNAHNKISGGTPLIASAEMGNAMLIQLLLTKGAEPCATDRDGTDALRMARKHHQQESADYLAAHFHCPDPPPPPPTSCINQSPGNCVMVR